MGKGDLWHVSTEVSLNNYRGIPVGVNRQGFGKVGGGGGLGWEATIFIALLI